MTDPIADMLTRLRNGAAARHSVVRVPRSASKERLGSILVEEGFVEAMNVSEQGHLSWLEFKLKYLVCYYLFSFMRFSKSLGCLCKMV